jgi:hypothetical protein
MLQVYDREISSASEITLLMLTIALLMAFLAMAGLDAVPARVLTRAGTRLDQTIAARVMTAIIHRSASAFAASCCAISTPSASSSPVWGIQFPAPGEAFPVWAQIFPVKLGREFSQKCLQRRGFQR